MILSSYYRSTAAYRVRIALALKGLEHEIKPVNLLEGAHRSSDYTANNPDGLVPTLHVENQYLGQSMAILEYLEETYPETPILPNTPLDRAYVRSISQTIASDMHPLNNLRVLKYLQQDLDVSESAKTDWYHHWLKQGFMAIEQKLQSSNKSGLCVYRDSPGLADVCLIPQLYNAHRFEFDLSDYPLINAIEKHCLSLPAFIQAHPSKQPDAPL